jgi:hypothetical protein
MAPGQMAPLAKRTKEALLSLAIMAVPCGVIFWSANRAQTIVPFLLESTLVVFAASVVFWTLAILLPYDRRAGRGWAIGVAIIIREMALWTLLIIIGAYVALGTFWVGKYALQSLSQRPLWQGAVGVAVFGTAAFLVRLKRRSLYGTLEVVFGIMVGTTTYTRSFQHGVADLKADWTSTNLALGVLTAGVYLVVRGLDNVHQGVEKDPKDPWAVAIWERLKRRYRREPVSDPSTAGVQGRHDI